MKLTFAWEDVYKQSWQYSLAWYNTKKSDINYVNSICAVCVVISPETQATLITLVFGFWEIYFFIISELVSRTCLFIAYCICLN